MNGQACLHYWEMGKENLRTRHYFWPFYNIPADYNLFLVFNPIKTVLNCPLLIP